MFTLRDEGGGLSERLVRVVDDIEQGRGDVFFVVGGKTYGALRGVLGLHSETFQRMLFGNWLEAQAKEPIALAQPGDVGADEFGPAFRSFLIYLHTMEVKVDSLVQLSDLLSLANYFGTPDLAAKCEACLQKVEIIPTNCVEMIHVCSKHRLSEQLRRAWNVLGAKADESLADPAAAVRLLPDKLLRHLFVSSVSNVSEVTLVRILAVLDDKERGELLPFVRLPLISASDMWNVVVPAGLFESKLCIQALAHQLDPGAIQVSPRSQVDKRTFHPEALIMWDFGIKGEDGPWRLFPGGKGKAAAFYALKGKGKNVPAHSWRSPIDGVWSAELAPSAVTPNGPPSYKPPPDPNNFQRDWFKILADPDFTPAPQPQPAPAVEPGCSPSEPPEMCTEASEKLPAQ